MTVGIPGTPTDSMRLIATATGVALEATSKFGDADLALEASVRQNLGICGTTVGCDHNRNAMLRRFTMAAMVLAVSIPASAATIGMASAGPAFAGSSVACTRMTGSETSKAGFSAFTIGRCTPSGGRGYKSATGLSNVLNPGGRLTWSLSGATTDITISSQIVLVPGACGRVHVEVDITGTVTGASTTGVGVPALGDFVSARFCVQVHSLKLKLVRGTSFTL